MRAWLSWISSSKDSQDSRVSSGLLTARSSSSARAMSDARCSCKDILTGPPFPAIKPGSAAARSMASSSSKVNGLGGTGGRGAGAGCALKGAGSVLALAVLLSAFSFSHRPCGSGQPGLPDSTSSGASSMTSSMIGPFQSGS